jgi:polyisoprenoid-binding protein YceI
MKKMLGLSLGLSAALGVAAPVQAAQYIIDGSGAGMHASITFRANHEGFSALWGRFDNISGSFSYDANDIGASSIEVKIDPASINTNQAARDAHLRTADYIDVEKYPEASFVSSKISDLGGGKIHVVGNFTLREITKEIAFDAVKVGEGDTPFNDYRVGFEAETALDVADFGIKLAPVSQLRLILAVEGIRQ